MICNFVCVLKNYAQIIVTIQGFSIGINYNYESAHYTKEKLKSKKTEGALSHNSKP